MEPTTRLLRDLVAIDSVNPSLVPGGAGEAAISEHLAVRLRHAGFDVERTELAPGRFNVVAMADGRAHGPIRLLCGHADTVGVDGMEAPFVPIEREGRLYGRGAQDMKGGLAAMVVAAEEWLAGSRAGAGRIIVGAVADEEFASLGAESLARTIPADAAVVPEPTDLVIGIAHKGFSSAEVTMRGHAAHGSRPAEGRDAILRMGRILARLERLDRHLQAAPPHPLLGTASLHASTISGGAALSVYPAQCTLQMERRTLPGEPLNAAVLELQGIVDALVAEDPDLAADVRALVARPAYTLGRESALVNELASAIRSGGAEPEVGGLSYWTDAAILAGAGIPAVVFGPGGAGLHGVEEYVSIRQTDVCRAVLRAWLEAGG